MRRAGLVFLAAAALAADAPAQDAAQPGLEGLWAARLRFGPDIRGPLIILRRGDGLQADLAGFTVPVRVQGDQLAFSLPDGRGDFRGLRRGPEISGQWIQAATAGIGRRFSTPVTLRADGRERWRGEIVPLADRVTHFLPVTRGADGRLTTFLRNPERNLGVFIPVSRIAAEGDTVRLTGTRRGAGGETELLSGRLDPDGATMRIPINGTTFDFVRDTRAMSPFYPRGRSGPPYVYAPPIRLDDGWPVATLEEEGLDRAAIERFVQSLIDMPMDGLGRSQIHGLLIARHGRLVLEEYFHEDDRDTPHDLRSASKSWTATLIGAAMQAGVPIRLDTPVYATMLGGLPADLDPRKRAMTLEHLITMTAGYDCDDSGERPGDEDVMQNQTDEADWYRYTLNVPMARGPGEAIVYCSIEPNLAGGMLERIAGEPLPEMFERLVARPLQMGRYHLFLSPTGAAYGGGGHRFRPRDFLKLPQLMLDGGRWGGRQIVSREWAERSTAPLRNLTPTQTYGFLWNSVAYPFRGRTVHAFFAAGNGGQIFMGIPELDLAIGFTGGNYSDAALFIPQRMMIPEQILPAVRE
jgi:CubicO group peptidase (beta-lactamase class C family)